MLDDTHRRCTPDNDVVDRGMLSCICAAPRRENEAFRTSLANCVAFLERTSCERQASRSIPAKLRLPGRVTPIRLKLHSRPSP